MSPLTSEGSHRFPSNQWIELGHKKQNTETKKMKTLLTSKALEINLNVVSSKMVTLNNKFYQIKSDEHVMQVISDIIFGKRSMDDGFNYIRHECTSYDSALNEVNPDYQDYKLFKNRVNYIITGLINTQARRGLNKVAQQKREISKLTFENRQLTKKASKAEMLEALLQKAATQACDGDLDAVLETLYDMI